MDFWKDKTLDEMYYYYNNQYDKIEGWTIPTIEMEKCEGDIVFMIYCFDIPTKYYTRVFDDPDSDFKLMMECETHD
jgi:hypothetical protein